MMSLQWEGLEYRLEAPRYGWMIYVASERGAACFILNESQELSLPVGDWLGKRRHIGTAITISRPAKAKGYASLWS